MNPSVESDMKLVREACESLSEHFDTVQVFATRYDSNLDQGTVNVLWGTGNWFARYGQIRTWLIKKDAETRKDAEAE